MVYQSLYRRYRSRRFADLKGQEHVVRALRHAVRDDRVGHAYLFSGPRGTGKTSAARILAKALNCDHLDDGDPCGDCESCHAIDQGTSFDLFELDAASNNGVDAIRDLTVRAGIGSPGRTKVYILDEVHMLSAGASNALLKTLEEPPPNVVFVLATTDPHKVLPTIRSRTQHLEFGLLPADVLAEHVRWVVADAGLAVDEEGIAYALRQGGGSARDTLSALEQVVAAGGVPREGGSLDDLISALCDRDGAAALSAVAEAVSVGREPRPLAEDLLAALRDIFLASVGGPLEHLGPQDREHARAHADRLGRASITRALELLGEAIGDMRHLGDPRIPLEVALVRLTSPEVDTSLVALVERVARLERSLASVDLPARSEPKATARSSAPSLPPAPPLPPSAREAVAEPAPPAAPIAPAAPAAPPATPETAAAGLPSLAELVRAWDESVLRSLSNKARARFGAGHFSEVDTHAVMVLPNAIHRDRCEELRPEVESALSAHFGGRVPLRLVVDESRSRPIQPARPAAEAPSDAAEEILSERVEIGDIDQLEDAADASVSAVERLSELFPGSEVVQE